MKHDPHDLTNAASGCTSNDGETILAAVREQHRRQLREDEDVHWLRRRVEELEDEIDSFNVIGGW